MAKNTGGGELKRTVYKYIRDGVKSNYVKKEFCEVCSCSEDLELHHPHTLSLVFDAYCASNGIIVKSVEDVLAMRDAFYKAHWQELVVDCITLCNTHHKALHTIYGSQPPLSTASKQRNWVDRIRDKLSGKDSTPTATEPRVLSGSGFDKFILGPSDFNRHIYRR